MKLRHVLVSRSGMVTAVVALFIVMSPVVPAVQAAAPGWQETRVDHGIRVYRRDIPNSRLVSFKGVGVVDTPADKLLSIILDTRRMPEWVTSLKLARVVRWIDRPTRFILYYWMDLPWPVRDREFFSRVTVSIDPETHRTRVDYVTSSHAVASSGRVLGELGGSYYILEPINGGRSTLVTGVAVVDPKGKVPKWIVNRYQKDWPHEVIMDLRRQSMKSDIRVLPDIEPLYSSGSGQGQSATGGAI